MKWVIIFLLLIIESFMVVGQMQGKDISTIEKQDNGILITNGNEHELRLGYENDYINLSLDAKGNLDILLFDESCIITPIIGKSGQEYSLENLSSLSKTALSFNTGIKRNDTAWYFNYTMDSKNLDGFYLDFYPKAVIDGNHVYCGNFDIDFTETVTKQSINLTASKMADRIQLTGNLDYIDPQVGYISTSLIEDVNMLNRTNTVSNKGNIGHQYSFIQWNLGSNFIRVTNKGDFVANLSMYRVTITGTDDNDITFAILYNQSISIPKDNETSIWLQQFYNATNLTVPTGTPIKNFNITNQTKGLMEYLKNNPYYNNPNMTIRICDPDFCSAVPNYRSALTAITMAIGNRTAITTTYNTKEVGTVDRREMMSIYWVDKVVINTPIDQSWAYNNQNPYVSVTSDRSCNNYTWINYRLFNGTWQNYTLGNGLLTMNNQTPYRFAMGTTNITAYCNSSTGDLYWDFHVFYLYNQTNINITKDTYINKEFSDYTYGNLSTLNVDCVGTTQCYRRYTLLYANFSRFENLTIGGVSLNLYSEASASHPIDIYKINVTWNEGNGSLNGNINSNTFNGSTWLERWYGDNSNDGNAPFNNDDPDWQTSGMGADKDYNGTKIGTFTPIISTYNSIIFNVTDMQDMVSNSSLNFGLVLRNTATQESANRFTSREGISTHIPYFSVVYIIGDGTDNEGSQPPVTTCNCVTNGNWNIDCTENCILSSDCQMQAESKVTASGGGTLTLNANIKGWRIFELNSGCILKCSAGKCII